MHGRNIAYFVSQNRKVERANLKFDWINQKFYQSFYHKEHANSIYSARKAALYVDYRKIVFLL